jgi:hypothetical protein
MNACTNILRVARHAYYEQYQCQRQRGHLGSHQHREGQVTRLW